MKHSDHQVATQWHYSYAKFNAKGHFTWQNPKETLLKIWLLGRRIMKNSSQRQSIFTKLSNRRFHKVQYTRFKNHTLQDVLGFTKQIF
jgi:hypothetical protein